MAGNWRTSDNQSNDRFRSPSSSSLESSLFPPHTSFQTRIPNQQFVGKPYKILHISIDSLTTAVSKIKEAEELYSLESRIFLESTGIYHYPLFCYLHDKGFNCSVINPIITKTSLTLLETYTSPSAFLKTDKQEIIDIIKSTAHFGLTYAQNKYNAIIQAATDANQFGYIIDSNIKRIRLYISFIRKYDEEINSILESLHELVDANEDSDFVKQIHLIETFKGAGFLSAVSIMGEIGDFSAFSKPKQLFAYFGLDPAVKQSGKFEGTKVQMSKRGSAIARRVIHTLTLQSISISHNGEAKNPVLREYYLKKCDSKPKLVAMGAVSHKVCNMMQQMGYRRCNLAVCDCLGCRMDRTCDWNCNLKATKLRPQPALQLTDTA